jgi:hypothetical protein
MTISASHSDAIVSLLQMNASNTFFVMVMMDKLCSHVHSNGRKFNEDSHGLKNEGAAFGLDTSHTLTIKGTPCTLAFIASNGEVAATNDAGLFAGGASSFDFLGVAGIELQGAWSTVSLEKLHGNDAATSVTNELTNDGSFVHGEEGR